LKPALFFLTLALLAQLPANANELQVIISGRAVHMGSNDLNENNYGLGLQYEFTNHRRWIPVINLASFKDSNDRTSRYIGTGLKRRYQFQPGHQRLNLDLGAAVLVMKRPGYNAGKSFIGALPFIGLSNEWGGINATYVPSIEADTLPFWYFQVTLKLMDF